VFQAFLLFRVFGLFVLHAAFFGICFGVESFFSGHFQGGFPKPRPALAFGAMLCPGQQKRVGVCFRSDATNPFKLVSSKGRVIKYAYKEVICMSIYMIFI